MEATAAARTPHDLSAAPIRLVVADDSPQARKAIEAIVDRARRFELVGSAASAEEAIELVGWLRPDLALLDVRMPGVGGIEAAQAISTAWPETVVVLVSALDEDELPTTLRTCGAKAFLSKSSLTARRLTALWSRCGESVVRRDAIGGDPDEARPSPHEHRDPGHEAEKPTVEGWTSGR